MKINDQLTNVCFAVHQQVDNIMTTLKTSQRESCVAIGLYLSIDITTMIKQNSDGRSVAIHGSQHKR